MTEPEPRSNSELDPRDAEKLQEVERFTRGLIDPDTCTPTGNGYFGAVTVDVAAGAGTFFTTVVATYDSDKSLRAVSVTTQTDSRYAQGGAWQNRLVYTPVNHMIALYENGRQTDGIMATPGDEGQYPWAVLHLHGLVRDAHLGYNPESFR